MNASKVERVFAFPGRGAILSIAANPEGSLIATSSMDGSVVLTNFACVFLLRFTLRFSSTGEDLVRLKDHSKYVIRVRFSGDGKTLVSASYDRTVCIYSVDALLSNDRTPKRLNFDSNVEAFVFVVFACAVLFAG